MRHAAFLLVVPCLLFSAAFVSVQDAETVYTAGKDGVTQPIVVKEVKPRYPHESLKEKKSGNVTLECVVTRKGFPTDVRVVNSGEPEFDEEAMKALRQWEFKPGTKEGKAVAVRIQVDMTFTAR